MSHSLNALFRNTIAHRTQINAMESACYVTIHCINIKNTHRNKICSFTNKTFSPWSHFLVCTSQVFRWNCIKYLFIVLLSWQTVESWTCSVFQIFFCTVLSYVRVGGVRMPKCEGRGCEPLNCSFTFVPLRDVIGHFNL